jgi:hypothetical protein
LLVAAGCGGCRRAALLGSPGGFCSAAPARSRAIAVCSKGATACIALMGLLVLVVAVALWLQKRWAFGAGVSFGCSGSA